MKLSIIEQRLKRDNQLPEDFHFWKWKSFPEGGETIYVEFTGGRCPITKSGERKGRPNYGAAFDKRTFHVTVQIAEQWEREYESETANCKCCDGSGETVSKINFVDGNTQYKPCRRCGGSGKAKISDIG